jgi:hypothetical protein
MTTRAAGHGGCRGQSLRAQPIAVSGRLRLSGGAELAKTRTWAAPRVTTPGTITALGVEAF